ncbi:MAG: hypothetical protein ABIO16_02990 [Nocardioides sp.]
MQTGGQDDATPFDRDHVLFGPLRESVLDLDQVRRYGATMFGDPDAISIYGMTPPTWYERGIRLLGRTVVECTRDSLSALIAADVAEVAATAPAATTLVFDPFTGSANTLFWMHRAIPDALAVGTELEPVIWETTWRNLELVPYPIDVRNGSYLDVLEDLATAPDGLAVVFVGPPWGHGFDPATGLDFDGTQPPVSQVVERIAAGLPGRPLLIAVQAFERIEPASLKSVTSMFDWSELRTYSLNPPGKNPATLLGTRGWTPDLS